MLHRTLPPARWPVTPFLRAFSSSASFSSLVDSGCFMSQQPFFSVFRTRVPLLCFPFATGRHCVSRQQFRTLQYTRPHPKNHSGSRQEWPTSQPPVSPAVFFWEFCPGHRPPTSVKCPFQILLPMQERNFTAGSASGFSFFTARPVSRPALPSGSGPGSP